MLRLLRMIKLARILKASRVIKRFSNTLLTEWDLPRATLKLFTLCAVLLLVTHLQACACAIRPPLKLSRTLAHPCSAAMPFPKSLRMPLYIPLTPTPPVSCPR